MRFPSIKLLVSAASATWARFPLVLLSAVAATLAAMLALEEVLKAEAARYMTTALLGIPLFTALALLAERKAWPRGYRLGTSGLGLAVLAGFFSLWSGWSEIEGFTRFAQFAAAFHLFVAFLPYVRVNEPNGFWQYNRVLFLRFLIATLFAGVLYAGLAIALLALDQLFGVSIPDEAYGHLWFLLAGVFHPWFFLSGLPRRLADLEGWREYPVVIKIFAQFILMPIVIIYLAILTAYLGKVLLTQDWPSGWIGYLVSSVAGVGILSLLLLAPAREHAENAWVTTYARWFYVALFPSIVMLLMAIWKRVSQYGFTEQRYFLTLLAAWLLGIAVYYAVRQSKDIKLIPASLCAVLVLSAFGPWSAYRVSERSQTNRLAGHLRNAGVLVDGRLVPAATEASFEDRKEISGSLAYLIEVHGTRSIEPWFDGELAAIDTASPVTVRSRVMAMSRTRVIMNHFGMAYVSPSEARAPDFFTLVPEQRSALTAVTGFDWHADIGRLPSNPLPIGGDTLRFELNEGKDALRLLDQGGPILTLPLGRMVDSARAHLRAHPGPPNTVPADLLQLGGQTDRLEVRVVIKHLSGRDSDDGLEINSINAEVLLDVK